MGFPIEYLSYQIRKDSQGSIHLTQKEDIKDMLILYNIEDVKQTMSPTLPDYAPDQTRTQRQPQ
eukprot:Ihof_evm13s198 gene=Ihof_evmTU13s198